MPVAIEDVQLRCDRPTGFPGFRRVKANGVGFNSAGKRQHDKEKNDGRCGRRQSSMRSYDGTASSTAKWGPLGAWSDTEMADHIRGVLAFRLFMGQLAVAWSVVG